MYIKILVYIIDNQQFKFKISIPFWLASRLPFLFSALRGLGGRSKKRQTPRPDFGEVVRPAYPSYPHIPIKSIHRPLTAFSLILLYLRYN